MASHDGRISPHPKTTPAATEDLGILTEEVISSVYTGHNHRYPLAHERSRSSVVRNSQDQSGDHPMVIVDIAKQDDYHYKIEAGAWRRILMNLFGNALKYTSAGFIKISLKTKEGPPDRDGNPQHIVTLTVRDSGKGISKEFLQNHLYSPFVQEDSLSVGSGLGLSIVRQIVDDHGGDITFKSEKGSGTEAIVSLPLTPAKKPSRSKTSSKASASTAVVPSSVPLLFGDRPDISAACQKTRGLRACLVGFDITPDMDDTSGILSAKAEKNLTARAALTSLMHDWFEMSVDSSSNLGNVVAEVYVITEVTYNTLIVKGRFLELIEEKLLHSPGFLRRPLLIVLTTSNIDLSKSTTGFYTVIGILQP
jgi:hypothetical protein